MREICADLNLEMTEIRVFERYIDNGLYMLFGRFDSAFSGDE